MLIPTYDFWPEVMICGSKFLIVVYIHAYCLTSEDIDSPPRVGWITIVLVLMFLKCPLGVNPTHVPYIDSNRWIIFLKVLICVHLKKVSYIHLGWHE